MSNENSEIDNIIDELKDGSLPSKNKQEIELKKIENLNDETVNEYVYKKSSELVESTLGAINSLKDNVLAASDPKEIAALSQLINSASKALDQLNKINLQNKQAKTNVEIKKMEIESNLNMSKTIPQTNNIVIATRDEIMDRMFNRSSKKEKLEIVDSEVL
jgi:hypothetical protein